jgi:hypothetical protein
MICFKQNQRLNVNCNEPELTIISFAGGIKMNSIKLNAFIITLSLIAAGVGAYILLHGHWATPITDWLVMH